MSIPHPMSRRDFLSAGLAAVTVLGRGAARGADNGPFAGFKVGAQSYTFRTFSLERAVKAIGEVGLHYVEFYRGHVPTNSTAEQIRSVLKLCKDHGVTPIAFGVERFTKDHDANKRLFEFGKQLGVHSLSADPDPDSFDSLDKLVDEYKIAIAIHPHGPTGRNLHRWYSAETILPAVKDRHPLIGTCLDTGHLIRSAQPPFRKHLDPADQIRKMGARNFGIHLKDHDNERKVDVILGKGSLDVAGVLKALREVKFQGSLNIEYEAKPDNPIDDVAGCVKVLQAAAKSA